jgi:hypothetical protein
MEIATALWETVQAHGHVGMELEFRLGHRLPDGSFSPNVGKTQFGTLKRTLDAAPFERIVDVETLEKISDVKHVTTLRFSEGPPPPVFCMVKNKQFHIDRDDTAGGPYVVRCSVAYERVVDCPPGAETASFTRYKKRTRYVYKNTWAFDLTEVTSNADVDSLETYEVEIELLDPGVLFDKTMDHIARTGLQFARDAIQIMTAK